MLKPMFDVRLGPTNPSNDVSADSGFPIGGMDA
jgi:hypothetical protein